MKLGALEIYWHPGVSTLRETVLMHLRDDPTARSITARMARSEVKNYLAELAELCEMPFTSPEGLIQALRTTAFIQLDTLEDRRQNVENLRKTGFAGDDEPNEEKCP
jgi:hypothetical protein